MAGAGTLLASEMSLKDMFMKASMWLLTHHAHLHVYLALPEIPPQKNSLRMQYAVEKFAVHWYAITKNVDKDCVMYTVGSHLGQTSNQNSRPSSC